MSFLSESVLGAVIVAVLAAVSLTRAEEDPLAPYRLTKVTQTEERGTDGVLKRVEVIRESRVNVAERIVETLTTGTNGIMALSSRVTWSQHTDGSTLTIVEQALPGQRDLTVVSVTTEVKDPSSGSRTVVETRDEQGKMVVTRQVVVENVDGTVVTTVHSLGADGSLYISARTVKQP